MSAPELRMMTAVFIEDESGVCDMEKDMADIPSQLRA
jgi:hypothetical protein